MEASYYEKKEDGKVKCMLCPRGCIVPCGGKGFCKVRHNDDGKLLSSVYGKAVSAGIDPIEKKPLFHFYPGAKVLSFGTVGCNLRCKHCQNWEISQRGEGGEDLLPEKIISIAKENGVSMIAATYNEPTIFFEYMLETFRLAKKEGMKTVVVSNGYINEKPMEELLGYADAFNIDLKGFDDKFYEKISLGHLKPVLERMRQIVNAGKWLEITNLIIPGHNDEMDKIREMSSWIKENLGKDFPVHFTAFYPCYDMQDVPPTDLDTLEKAHQTAREEGLDHVYLGNIRSEKESTFCPSCNELIIEREGYLIKNKGKKCPSCGHEIIGRIRGDTSPNS
ncbi:MAG: AmmeMemoRadiSam system radical SAM enzyme [Nanobdellota archaeon]